MKAVLTSCFLFVVTWAAYYQSLDFWWTWDDTVILRHAWTYAPWQYFLVPESWQVLSGASLTPWVSLSFDLDLALLGLHPRGFYVHQLLALWLTASASHLLLRLYVRPSAALFGSLLFLLSAPAVAMSHQLMTRHYLEGLLFAVLALCAWVAAMRAEERRRRGWLLAASLLAYSLAVTAKEVFVPLPFILPFLPEADLKRRLRSLLPYLLPVGLYCVWRFFMLAALVGGFEEAAEPMLEWQLRLPLYVMGMIFGDGTYQTVAMLSLVGLAALGLWTLSTSRTLIPAALLLVGLPLLPVVPMLIGQHPLSQRLIILPGWALCMAIALIAGRSSPEREGIRPTLVAGTLLLCALLSALGLRQSLAVDSALKEVRKSYEASGRFIHEAGPEQVLIDAGDWFAPSALWLRRQGSGDGPSLIFDWIQLDPDDIGKKQFFQYQQGCECVQDVTARVPDLWERWKS
ncbi:MAG: hypothetical protein CL910_07240 [Deltaproteobacteria bacterium]|nr:hypothetical protein [Deltaproteobacteria bacterium]